MMDCHWPNALDHNRGMQYSILNRELYIIEYLGKDYLFTYETSLLLPNLSSFHFFQKTTAFFQLFSACKDASLISAARASSTCFVTRATRFNFFRFFDILFSSLRFLFLLSRFLSCISSLVFGRESQHCLAFLSQIVAHPTVSKCATHCVEDLARMRHSGRFCTSSQPPDSSECKQHGKQIKLRSFVDLFEELLLLALAAVKTTFKMSKVLVGDSAV